MEDAAPQAGRSTTPLRRGRRFIGWLVRPLVTHASIETRRERLLAWLLVSLMGLLFAALLLVAAVDPMGSTRWGVYAPLILTLGGLFSVVYLLDAAGYYLAAAWITVGLTALVPWVSLVFDPKVMAGDFVPVLYVTVAVMLSSFLLSPWSTVAVAVIQCAGLAVVALRDTSLPPFNWESAFTLVVILSAIGVLSGAVRRADQSEILENTQRLAERELQLKELVARDHLTGLFNRRYLEETLDREIARASRASESVGVIVLDLDHFKRINDGWGHAGGDEVLRQLAQLIGSHARESDVACRCGGDEFVLVLPDASREVTALRADALRVALKEHQADGGVPARYSVTISLGVASFPEDGLTGNDVLKAADKALYRAKEAGRDCTFVGATRLA